MARELDKFLESKKPVGDVLFNFADRFLNGDGVKKDPVRAQLLFERAAGIGYTPAASSLNLMQSIWKLDSVHEAVQLEDGWATDMKLEPEQLLGSGSFGKGKYFAIY